MNGIQITSRGAFAWISPLGATLLNWTSATGRRVTIGAAGEWPEHRIGCVVGRFSRLLANGAYAFDGSEHRLSQNFGEHHIHGGLEGFGDREWTVRRVTRHSVILELLSPALDQGYPGMCLTRIVYRISGATLSTTIESHVSAPTLCDVILHPFFSLDGNGLYNHRLVIGEASRVLQSPEFVPSGDVERPRFWDIDLGNRQVDDYFALKRSPWEITLTNGASSLVLQSEQPGVAVYTGDNLPQARIGVCLQASAWPDAPNQTLAPSAIAFPGRPTIRRTRYTLLEG